MKNLICALAITLNLVSTLSYSDTAHAQNMSPTADFDGDAKSDIIVWRPNLGMWFVLTSTSSFDFSSHVQIQLGLQSDVPLVGDLDGDKRADLAVWRPQTGMWYYRLSSESYETINAIQWGLPFDWPLFGDWDGDGISDLAVYRAELKTFLVLPSSTGFDRSGALLENKVLMGSLGDFGHIPLVGDYDGNGIDDFVTFSTHPDIHSLSNANAFWSAKTTDNQLLFSLPWGKQDDEPLSCDLDGDGVSDRIVVRPGPDMSLNWYVLLNSGLVEVHSLGHFADIPLCDRDYDGDGRDDISVFQPQGATWKILLSDSLEELHIQFGLSTDVVPGRAYHREVPTGGSYRIQHFSCGDFNKCEIELTSLNNFGSVAGDYNDIPAIFTGRDAGMHFRKGMPNAGFSVSSLSDNGNMIFRDTSWTSQKSFVYDGTLKELGTLGGESTYASDINNLGQVVGSSKTAKGQPALTHAFLYENEQMQDLGSLGGDFSEASAINATGQVVGVSLNTDGNFHAFIYDRQTGMRQIPHPDAIDSAAADINNRGIVTGHTSDIDSICNSAFLYDSKNNTTKNIAFNKNIADCFFPVSINDMEQVVGYLEIIDSPERPVLWDANRGFTDLECYYPRNLGLGELKVKNINNAQQILLTSFPASNHLMTPVDISSPQAPRFCPVISSAISSNCNKTNGDGTPVAVEPGTQCTIDVNFSLPDGTPLAQQQVNRQKVQYISDSDGGFLAFDDSTKAITNSEGTARFTFEVHDTNCYRVVGPFNNPQLYERESEVIEIHVKGSKALNHSCISQ